MGGREEQEDDEL